VSIARAPDATSADGRWSGGCTPVRTRVARAAGVAAVLALASMVTVASRASATARVTGLLTKYSPARLAAGRVWTLPASALLLGHPRMIGPTTGFVVLILAPYALWRGVGRAALTGMAGHVVSTLVVAAVVLPAAALGSGSASSIVHTLDDGASAVLAACAGGLAVAISRRRLLAGAGLFVAIAGWFLVHLLTVHQPMANVADVEHLVALGTGAIVEWRLSMPKVPIPMHRFADPATTA
jgi:hypothetical protein